MPLPTFVINLARSADRWRAISENLDRIGLAATRIEAVDGLTLQDHPCVATLGAGALGCAISHVRAMEAFLETDAPAALILEDDVEVGASVPAIIQSAEWWPEGHGLVKLESPYRSRSRLIVRSSVGVTPDRRSLHPIVRKHVCAFGYLVDRATAGRVAALRDVRMPIDYLLFSLLDSPIARQARPLQMVPGPVRHPPPEANGSIIAAMGRYGDRQGLFGSRRPWRSSRIAHLGGKLASRVLVLGGGGETHPCAV